MRVFSTTIYVCSCHGLAASRLKPVIRAFSLLCGTSILVLLAMVLGAGPATATTCADSLQEKIRAASPGDTVRAEPCIYRETITIDKPVTLEGQEGTELRGSDVWPDSYWKLRRSDRRWVSTKTLPKLRENVEHVYCMPRTSRCRWPEQVFIDEKALSQVGGAKPAKGQFGLTRDRRVVLRDNPQGKVVEVSVRKHWILGDADADGVTISNIDMRHAAAPPRTAALMNRPCRTCWTEAGERWTLRDSTLADSAGTNLSLKGAPGHKVLGNRILRAGQLNVHELGAHSTLANNEIAFGNTERFCYDAQCGIGETGGIKITYSHDVTVSGNDVHDNYGHGIHFDLETSNIRIEGNRVYDNARMGIHYELSEHGTISDNVVYENGWTTPEWYKGGGIVIQNSSSTEVYNNRLAWNSDGVVVFALDREGTKYDLVHDVYIHDNTIFSTSGSTNEENSVALAWLQGWNNTLFDPANNNRGTNNKYWYPTREDSSERFRWRNKAISSLASFNATPGEENGTYLDSGEKESVMTTNGIPGAP